MRLLHTAKYTIQDFILDIPQFAILSHTWSSSEVTFQDIQNAESDFRAGPAFSKIEACCNQARNDGYTWVWIDTCCIDKTSSSELSEAINSMFSWYQKAHICYVYLSDYRSQSPEGSKTSSTFQECRWFSRGWTLQELIAPILVEFYDQDWIGVGTKSSFAKELNRITKIPLAVLDGASASTCSVGERMSWASNRATGRQEDSAYCLMGLFNVYMPLIYGEGKHKAFMRLQEEILKVEEDHSLFIWTRYHDSDQVHGLLAPSSSNFQQTSIKDGWQSLQYNSLQQTSHDIPTVKVENDGRGLAIPLSTSFNGHPYEPASVTNRGLRISLLLQSVDDLDPSEQLVALLDVNAKETKTRLALILTRAKSADSSLSVTTFCIMGSSSICFAGRDPWPAGNRIFFRRKTIYINGGAGLEMPGIPKEPSSYAYFFSPALQGATHIASAVVDTEYKFFTWEACGTFDPFFTQARALAFAFRNDQKTFYFGVYIGIQEEKQIGWGYIKTGERSSFTEGRKEPVSRGWSDRQSLRLTPSIYVNLAVRRLAAYRLALALKIHLSVTSSPLYPVPKSSSSDGILEGGYVQVGTRTMLEQKEDWKQSTTLIEDSFKYYN